MVCLISTALYPAAIVHADDLYRADVTKSLVTDQKASRAGDTITVIIVQTAESSSSMRNQTSRSTAVSGQFNAGRINEGANLSLGNNFNGQGEVRRSERFVTQMAASITEILPNGDYAIAGTQNMNINGENTTVQVKGRIRSTDIDASNMVPSNRISDAVINYNGKGFVSRSSKPGLINKIFGFLGL